MLFPILIILLVVSYTLAGRLVQATTNLSYYYDYNDYKTTIITITATIISIIANTTTIL